MPCGALGAVIIAAWLVEAKQSVVESENIVLLVNLGWSAVLYARFVTRRMPFALMERWQTAYLPVYFVWAWIVVVLFPRVFRFQ